MAILSGFTLDQTLAEAKLGRKLDPRVYTTTNMQGHRLLIARDTAEEMYKGVIAKPRAAIDREQNESGAGLVIAVGPLVGRADPPAPHPTGVLCDHPTDLLGKRVCYFMYAGKVFRSEDEDSEFSAGLVIMTDRDIQAVLEDDEPGEFEKLARSSVADSTDILRALESEDVEVS